MAFQIKYKDEKTKARVGILQTKSGKIETPFFMPVATKASVKHISSQELEEINAKAVISNAFILFLRPGIDMIKKAGGISKFMNYNGKIFTDSGGFQMYSKELYLKSKENEVVFRNPFSGEKIFITPEKDMEIQLALNADVAMCLDSMPLLSDSKESIAEACRKTALWAKKCKIHHDKLQRGIKEKDKQLLFGIVQGGIHGDLRKRSALEILKINFDGYAIGGLALGEPKETEMKMIDIVKKILPEEKPVYLMGAGNPVELLEAVSRGMDMFDSRFPTQSARRGTLFTSKGRLSLKSARYKNDLAPIDKKCKCFACKNYSRAYVRYLLSQEEGFGYRLASYHNLYFLQKLMDNARRAIKKGKFKEFLKSFKKMYNNGAL